MEAKLSFLFLTISLLAVTTRADDVDRYLKFPADFKLGVGTSSYQTEGAWDVSDKGVNIWDEFTHRNPSPILNGSNGDVACDSYNKYKEDTTILRNLGVDSYRISLSWSRILPTGFANKISSDGIQYYKNLLDDLNAVGIEPLVTLYHWDHPAVLEEMGGWTNEMMVTWFADYARIVFNELGDRVKIFATVNEPSVICRLGYGEGSKAPGKKLGTVGPYLCVHNILKAHAKVYKIFHHEFRNKIQGGKIGIIMNCPYYYPKHKDDTETANVKFAFECGWIADPIYSKMGDYPAVMKKQIGENSKLEGYPRSKLPEFTECEIDNIRGSADYFGLNHYTTSLTEPAPKSKNTLWYGDTGVIATYNSSSFDRDGVPLNPDEALGDLLRRLKFLYDNSPVYVMGNGFSDGGSSLNDHNRIQYLHDYLRETLLAVNRDNCNVKGYFAWSFLDHFEWEQGYEIRNGLVSVDFENSNRPRTTKLSFSWFKELVRARELLPVDAVSDITH